MKAAIVHNGVVENVVSVPEGWTGADGEWQPPKGKDAVVSDVAKIGDAYDGGAFITPEPDPRPDPIRQFTKLQITEALFSLIGEANTDAALENMKVNNRRAYLRWDAASRIDEDDADFLAQLTAMGITLDQLKAAIDAQ